MKILLVIFVALVIGICIGLGLGRRGVTSQVTSNAESVPVAKGSVTRASMLDVLECHDRVVSNGLETLILPKEAETLFGATNVDHFISNFGSQSLAPVWNSVAYFAGRYRLSLRVPIAIDYDDCRLKGAINSAQIQINEVTKVEISTSGIAGAHMKGQWRLNENEWKWLVKNNGDWSVVRVPIVTNAPVKDFDEYVRQGREPIRNRKEGFDKPVRDTLEKLRGHHPAANSNSKN